MTYNLVAALTEADFKKFTGLIYQYAGIHMNASKKALVEGRLRKRLVALKLGNYAEYYKIIKNDNLPNERQRFIDLLTTNETWFFREEKHFSFLDEKLAEMPPQQPVSIWSAACSSGQEPYSLAMQMTESRTLQRPWDILATDISTDILTTARKGIYFKEKIKGLSKQQIYKYMLKGVRTQADYLAIVPELKKKVEFRHFNLLESTLPTKKFDFIFCRNVLIYFDAEHKLKVIKRLAGCLKSGGYLMTGHAESLLGIYDELQVVKPSIYQKSWGG